MKDQLYKNILAKADYVDFWKEDFNITKVEGNLENLPDKQMAEVIDFVIEALE